MMKGKKIKHLPYSKKGMATAKMMQKKGLKVSYRQ